MRRRPFLVPGLLFVGLLLVYLASGRSGGDTLPTRYLPFAILQGGTFCLDDMPRSLASPTAWWVRRTTRCLVSEYPVIPALLALPAYAPLAVARVDLEGPWPARLEKLTAAMIVALTVALLLVVLNRMTDAPSAVALALVCGLATTNLSTNAHALWHADAAALGLVAALYCIVRGRDEPTWVARSAFPLALAILSRPQTFFIVAPVALYALMLRPGITRFVAWGLPLVAFQIWYNAHYFGNPLRTQFSGTDGLFSMDLAEGLYGLLLSPGRGLFIYSPIFLLSVAGAIVVWRRGGDGLLRALSLGIAPTILFYARYVFWNGGTYGPRYLGDLNVTLTMLLVPLVPWARARAALAAAAVLMTVSVVPHAWGAFFYEGERDATDVLEQTWLWRKHPLVGHLLPRPPTIARSAEPFFLDLQSRSGGDGSVDLAVNRVRLARGDTLSLGLDARNSGAHPLDLYAGVAVPGERVVLFFAAIQTTTSAVPFSHPEWFREIRRIAPHSHVLEPEVFRLTVPSSRILPTELWAFAALVEPGTRPWRVTAADVERIEIRW
jgi:hypothetical protein